MNGFPCGCLGHNYQLNYHHKDNMIWDIVLSVQDSKSLKNVLANIIDVTLEAITNTIVFDYGYVTLVNDDEKRLAAHRIALLKFKPFQLNCIKPPLSVEKWRFCAIGAKVKPPQERQPL